MSNKNKPIQVASLNKSSKEKSSQPTTGIDIDTLETLNAVLHSTKVLSAAVRLLKKIVTEIQWRLNSKNNSQTI